LIVLAEVITWYIKYDLEKSSKEIIELKEIISVLNKQVIVLRNLGPNRRYVINTVEEQKTLINQIENRITMLGKI